MKNIKRKKIKQITSFVLTGFALVALSGCGGESYASCNVLLQYVGSTDGSGSASSIRLDNFSDYRIDRVYSGVDGDIEVSSVHIPTYPGEYFIADSSYCGRDEILRIVDDEGCEQAVGFYRARQPILK